MHQRVAVIVLNWNDAETTCRCLDALRAMEVQASIFVCDNGSVDDSIEVLTAFLRRHGLAFECHRQPPQETCVEGVIHVLCLAKNNGYAAGNNAGIRFAQTGRFDYIWILNNDAFPHPQALTALLTCAESNPDIAIWGATVVQGQHPNLLESAGGCGYTPLTTIRRARHAGASVSRIHELPEPSLDYINGAALFVRASLFRAVGLFDERYFLYYEELDFCTRAKLAGQRLGWCRGAIVEHQGGSASSRQASDFIQYHENRSTLLFTQRHRPLLFWPAALFRLIAKVCILTIRGRPNLLRAVLRAYAEVLRSCD